MKIASISCIVLLLAWVGLTLAEMWGNIIPLGLYWKITISIVILGLAIVAVALIIREYVEEKSLRNDKYLD